MSDARICGKTAGEMVGTTPFASVLVLDYYDGPVSGIVRCASCETCYQFHLLDWDADHVIRVFCLSEIAKDVADEFKRIQSEAVAASPARYRRLLDLLPETVSHWIIVAWRNSDHSILAARVADRLAFDQITDQLFQEGWSFENASYDWFGYVGLVK
jgi:hypothetical protein